MLLWVAYPLKVLVGAYGSLCPFARFASGLIGYRMRLSLFDWIKRRMRPLVWQRQNRYPRNSNQALGGPMRGHSRGRGRER